MPPTVEIPDLPPPSHSPTQASISGADLPSCCPRSWAPGHFRLLPPPSAPSPHRPATTQPSQLRAAVSLPPTLDPRVSKPSSMGGGQTQILLGGGVWVRVRQVCVCERQRESVGACVPARGLQMCLRLWEGEPGERDKRRERADDCAAACRLGG